MTLTFKKTPRLREQFAIGARDALVSDLEICERLEKGLSTSVLRISNGRNIFELNASAAIIWLCLDNADNMPSLTSLISSRYPNVANGLVRDCSSFLASCVVDGLIIQS